VDRTKWITLSKHPAHWPLVFEAHRLLYNLRLKDLLGPVTRVKKKKKKHWPRLWKQARGRLERAAYGVGCRALAGVQRVS